MGIPLNYFEDYITEKILDRGLSYYNNGQVHEPVEISPGKFEFQVEGTLDYTVQLCITDDMVSEYYCNCPYDMGPVCKHVVAALYKLNVEIFDSKNEPSQKSKTTTKKRDNWVEKVDRLLETVSHEELKRFVRRQTEKDLSYRDLFLAHFLHKTEMESKQTYTNQIQAILRSLSGSFGFIDWDAAIQLSSAIQDILETAHQHIEAGRQQSAFYIGTAVLEQMTEALQFADDSNGDIGFGVHGAVDVLQKLTEVNLEEQVRKQILDYCVTAFNNGIYEGWDWHTKMLFIAASILQTEAEADEILENINKSQLSEFDMEMVQNVTYQILNEFKGDAEAETYLYQHISNPELRRKAIKKAIENQNFDKAKTLSKEGWKNDIKSKRGLALEWKDWLLKIAQTQQNTEEIIKHARYLLIDNFRQEQDYYQILKQQVPSDQWDIFIKNVASDIKKTDRLLNTDLLAKIYIKEEWWNELFELVKRQKTLYSLEYYEKYLIDHFADEIMELYSHRIMDYLANNMGRKHYKIICRYLRHMKKLGGHQTVNRTVSEIQKTYSNRPALMEELQKV